jgi:hypothetical protein
MVALPGRDRDPEGATASSHRLQLDQGLGNAHRPTARWVSGRPARR